MRFHILDRTFERIGSTGFVISEPDSEVPAIVDVGQWSYADARSLDDAQILALTIGAVLKGIM